MGKYPKHWKKLLHIDLLLLFLDAIMHDDHLYFHIWGKKRSGKSVLAAHLMYLIYGSWDEVKRHFVRSIQDMSQVIEEDVRRYGRCWIITFDDLGAVMSGLEPYSAEEKAFLKYFETIGTDVAVLLSTSTRLRKGKKAMRVCF